MNINSTLIFPLLRYNLTVKIVKYTNLNGVLYKKWTRLTARGDANAKVSVQGHSISRIAMGGAVIDHTAIVVTKSTDSMHWMDEQGPREKYFKR